MARLNCFINMICIFTLRREQQRCFAWTNQWLFSHLGAATSNWFETLTYYIFIITCKMISKTVLLHFSSHWIPSKNEGSIIILKQNVLLGCHTDSYQHLPVCLRAKVVKLAVLIMTSPPAVFPTAFKSSNVHDRNQQVASKHDLLDCQLFRCRSQTMLSFQLGKLFSKQPWLPELLKMFWWSIPAHYDVMMLESTSNVSRFGKTELNLLTVNN